LKDLLQLSSEAHLSLNKFFGFIKVDSWVVLDKHHEKFKGLLILLGKLFEERGKLNLPIFFLVDLIHEIFTSTLTLVLIQVL